MKLNTAPLMLGFGKLIPAYIFMQQVGWKLMTPIGGDTIRRSSVMSFMKSTIMLSFFFSTYAYSYNPCDFRHGNPYIASPLPQEVEECDNFRNQQARLQELQIRKMELELQQNQSTIASPAQPAGPSPEFLNFTKSNPWYMKDQEMTQFADNLGHDLINDGLSPSQIYKVVHRAVRDKFPQKFK